jgi:hypothetical protein
MKYIVTKAYTDFATLGSFKIGEIFEADSKITAGHNHQIIGDYFIVIENLEFRRIPCSHAEPLRAYKLRQL